MKYTNVCPSCGSSKFVKEASKVYIELHFSGGSKESTQYGIDHGTDIRCKCATCGMELCVWSSYADWTTDALNVYLEKCEDIYIAIEAIKNGGKAPVYLSFNHCNEITIKQ